MRPVRFWQANPVVGTRAEEKVEFVLDPVIVYRVYTLELKANRSWPERAAWKIKTRRGKLAGIPGHQSSLVLCGDKLYIAALCSSRFL